MINRSPERSCRGKRRHRDRRTARARARILRQISGDDIYAYRCVYCTLWHTGHRRAVPEDAPVIRAPTLTATDRCSTT